MKYEIIALDIDGTLTNSKKEITKRTKTKLIEAQKRGKKVILASGRHNLGMKSIAEELELNKYGGYVMAFNGGKIINAQTDEVIHTVYLPRKYIEPVYNLVKDENITVITFEEKRIIMSQHTNEYSDVEANILKLECVVTEDFVKFVDFDVNKLLLAGEPQLIDKYEKILSENYKGYFDVFKSCPFFLEVVPLGVNKGACLSKLLKKICYSREQLIACGDSYNDMTMIGYAGLGVCMDNGEDDVKKIADVIADSNDDEGIAKIVEKYMLEKIE